MTAEASDWYLRGRGQAPQLAWSASVESGLVGIDLALESGCTYAADTSGGVYAFSPTGQLLNVSRGFSNIHQIAWSAVGTEGAICSKDRQLTWLNAQLQPVWSRNLTSIPTGLGIAPFAGMAVICLENHRNYIVRSDREELNSFDSVRPMAHVAFLTNSPALIAASEDGVVCRYGLDGKLQWKTDLIQPLGDLAVSADGSTILLASFQQGITILDGDGTRQGTFVVSGTVDHVATGQDGEQLMLGTVERETCRLDINGNPCWDAMSPVRITGMKSLPRENGAVVGFESGRIEFLRWPLSDD